MHSDGQPICFRLPDPAQTLLETQSAPPHFLQHSGKAGQIVETGENVLLIRVDTPVEEETMEDLMDLPNVNSVQLLHIS